MAKKKVDEPTTEGPELVVEPDKTEDTIETLVAKPKDASGDGRLKRLWHAYTSKKKITIPATLLVAVLLVLAIPFSRYKVLGLFIKKDFTVIVVDSETGKPVSGVMAHIGGKSATTDGAGRATIIRAPLGKQTLSVTKKYYRDLSTKVLVSITASKNTYDAKLEATGRQVPIAVRHRITGAGLKGVKVTVLDTQAETDEKGETVVVLPADKTKEKATLKFDGFNELTVDIEVSEQLIDANKLSMTPAGKVYFVSKQSGKFDIVKTNLDGTDRQIVLEGTGKEEQQGLELYYSRSNKYIAFRGLREGTRPKLYLLDTSTDKLSTIDEGEANFFPVGWVNDSFVYWLERTNVLNWQDKQRGIKAYNAKTGKLTTLDETAATGTSLSSFAQEQYTYPIYRTKEGIVFSKHWYQYNEYSNLNAKKSRIISINTDGSNKKIHKEYPTSLTDYVKGIETWTEGPYKVFFQVATVGNSGVQFVANPQGADLFSYENGNFVTITNAEEKKRQISGEGRRYDTYYVSPSGSKTLRSEARDGKYAVLIGNSDGKDEKVITTLSEVFPLGWYSEEYILGAKRNGGGELYIIAVRQDAQAVRVIDSFTQASSGNPY